MIKNSDRRLQRMRSLRGARRQRALHRLLALDPRQPELLFELGVQQEATSPGQAMTSYRKAVWADPKHADGWYRLGLLQASAGNFAAAVLALGRHLSLRPQSRSLMAYLYLATALVQLGQPQQALPLYLRALELDQDNPLTFFALSQVLQQLGDPELALESLMTLGRLYPAKLDLISFLMGYQLEKQGQAQAARQCYDEALRRQPRQLFWQLKRDLVRPLIPASREDLDQHEAAMEAALQRTVERLRSLPVQLPREQFFQLAMIHGSLALMAYSHRDPLPARRLLAELVERALPKVAPWQQPPRNEKNGHKIRLGILIAQRSLIMAYHWALTLADRLDPERFEVVLLSPSQDVAGLFGPGARYPVTGKHVRWQLISLDPYKAMEEIRSLSLDAAFFTEPHWDFDQYLLAQFRIAGFQFVNWMSPSSTGLQAMDAYLSWDLIEPPDARRHYSEALAPLPTIPAWIPPFVAPPPAPRADFGLQDDWHVYACLQNLFKMHPDFEQLIGEILRRDPKGHVVLVSSRDQGHLTEVLMQRFMRNIPDEMERIWVFPELSNQEYLQLLACSDVALDPLYFGSGSSCWQILASGLPLVTLPGERMIGRISMAFSSWIGITDGIVADQQAYIDKAVQLAQDKALRADIRRRTLANVAGLYQNQDAITAFAAFLQRHCR